MKLYTDFSQLDTMFRRLEGKTAYAVKRGLYEGANIMADELKVIAKDLPEDYGYIDRSRPRKKARLTGLLSKQIDGLVDGVGIAKMKKKGNAYKVNIGFDGYNTYKTKTYPEGQPNALIVRSLVKGTAYLVPNKFVTRAFLNAKHKAEKRIIDEITRVMTEDNIK